MGTQGKRKNQKQERKKKHKTKRGDEISPQANWLLPYGKPYFQGLVK